MLGLGVVGVYIMSFIDHKCNRIIFKWLENIMRAYI